MAEQVLLSTHGLHKFYGKHDAKFEALRGINIEIHEGESVAIVGKSGSGKSTLMHLLALLDKPSKGEIRLSGENTSKLRQGRLNHLRNKKFGFVFQSFFMNSNDTVLNNVILPLKISGIRSKERRRKALHALKIVELDSKAHNKANDLSGGQKQRVCIARAIVNDPEVIFADEPTGNLDSATGEKIEKILFDLNREKGITLIIVTHDADLAAKCSRQIHIADGRVVSDSGYISRDEREDVEITLTDEAEITAVHHHQTADGDADGFIDHNRIHRVEIEDESEEEA